MPDSPLSWRVAHLHLFSHLTLMPSWQKGVMFIATLLAGLGGLGTVVAGFDTKSNSAPSAQTSNVVNSKDTSSQKKPADDSKSLTARISPHAMRIGISLLVGFLVGWFFRAFIKTMTLIALVVVGGLFALSYFGILNIDMTSVQKTATSTIGWLSDQGSKVKDIILAHVPSSGGAGFGAFMGFRRR